MPAAIEGVSLVGIQNEAGGAIRGRAGEIPREKRGGEEKGGKTTTHSSRLSAKPLPSFPPSFPTPICLSLDSLQRERQREREAERERGGQRRPAHSRILDGGREGKP